MIFLINILLLFFVFGAQRKKMNAYWAALLLGLIKAVIYLIFTRQLLVAAVMGITFAGLTAALVYFLKRLDQRDAATKEAVPVYRSAGSEKMTFRWEYLPLVVLMLLIIGGEVLL